MEDLLLASGAFLAFQKLPLGRSLGRALGIPEDGEPVDCQDAMGPRLKRFYTQDEVNTCYADQRQETRSSDLARAKDDGYTPTVSTYFPDQKFYNYAPRSQPPVASQRLNNSRPIPTNPVQQQMMEDIRNPIKHTAIGATAYRPSWIRQSEITSQNRQEEERKWEDTRPADAQDNMHAFQHAYRAQSTAAMNAFGQGGVPEEQQFIAPDGLHPIASNRKLEQRYHRYTLDHDLSTSSKDDGMSRGVAAGQERGGLVRADGLQLNIDYDMQMQASSAVKPMNAGIRSGGVGVPLSSFIGQQPVEPLENMRGNHQQDLGTGRKSAVGSFPVKPRDDPLDKRFIYEQVDAAKSATGAAYASAISSNKGFRGAQIDPIEHIADVDTNAASTNVSMHDRVIKKSNADLSEKVAWKFSFDLKQLFDVTTANTSVKKNRDAILSAPNDVRGTVVDMVDDKALQRIGLNTSAGNERIEAMPDKKIVFGSNERNDFSASSNKRREADFTAQSKNAALFKRVTTFKTETVNEEKGVSTTNIKANKAHITKPMGSDLSGRNVPIKASGALTKNSAIDAGMLYNNDVIMERGAQILEPIRAPKGASTDYAFSKVNASRNENEFRKR